MGILAKDASYTDLPTDFNSKTCTIIDGMTIVQAIGRPDTAYTFGNFLDAYVKSNGHNSSRIVIVFDHHR